jgi:hypothetical protein
MKRPAGCTENDQFWDMAATHPLLGNKVNVAGSEGG